MPVFGDFDAEGNETFFVDVYEEDPSFVVDRGIGTIQEDDQSLVVNVSDAAAVEGTPPGAPGVLTFDMSLSRPLEFGEPPASVSYASADGSARGDIDYFGVAGTLTFDVNGPTSQSVIVSTRPDAGVEPHETFSLNLTAGARTIVGDGQETGTIQNDDFPTPPTVDAGNDFEREPANSIFSTPRYLTFPVSLSRPLVDGEVVGVSYRTVSGTANTNDYQSTAGRLIFVAGGSLRQDVAVRLDGDDIPERPETVFLDLSEPAGVIIADARGVGIIHDEDAEQPTTATVHSPTPPVTEGDAGTTSVAFTITLDAPSESGRNIGYATRDGSAASGSDYVGRTGSVFLAPYRDSATVMIDIRGDVLDELDEVFYLDVGISGVVVANSGIVVIRDDDPAPTLFITDVRRDEGNAGVTPFIFDVTLSAASGRAVSVTATTAPDSAIAGDFTAGTARLTFNPGETVKSFAVHVNGDTTFEPDERFFVDLSNPDGATITDAQGVGTIVNDDAEPGPPLHVVGVFFNSTHWSPAFRSHLAASGMGSARFGYAVTAADQLNELPWAFLNEVSVRFDGDATVRQEDLTLRGVRVSAYAIDGFNYDADTDTATWTFGGAIGNDNLMLDLRSRSDGGAGAGVPRLDGDWLNGADSFPSGDGFPAGDFRFRANVAPGDTTRSGAVTAADDFEVRRRRGSAAGRRADYSVFHDLNGDGDINLRDEVLVRRWMSTRSPATASPAALAIAPAPSRARPLTRDLFSSSSVIADLRTRIEPV